MPLMVVCLVPAAPVLLPRLTGSRVPEVAPVRAAVGEALSALAGLDRVVVVSEAVPGTLAGLGAPEPGSSTVEPGPATATAAGVAAGPGRAPEPPAWPRELADELLDGSWRGGTAVGDLAVREHRTWAQVTPRLPAELDAAPDRVGLLLLADGSRTRGPRAPGGQDPRGDVVDAELCAALVEGRAAEVPDARRVGATAEAAVALLAVAPGGPTRVLHHEAPLGVAYLVAVRGRVAG
ncbi:hypothetical protein [Aquipuribacter sp. MA13-6]|uniref:hypothetical protein n=1 Tax=unclassified Aquipuribacter TaxID=2635084 RepID=UPI003EEC4EDD